MFGQKHPPDCGINLFRPYPLLLQDFFYPAQSALIKGAINFTGIIPLQPQHLRTVVCAFPDENLLIIRLEERNQTAPGPHTVMISQISLFFEVFVKGFYSLFKAGAFIKKLIGQIGKLRLLQGINRHIFGIKTVKLQGAVKGSGYAHRVGFVADFALIGTIPQGITGNAGIFAHFAPAFICFVFKFVNRFSAAGFGNVYGFRHDTDCTGVVP